MQLTPPAEHCNAWVNQLICMHLQCNQRADLRMTKTFENSIQRRRSSLTSVFKLCFKCTFALLIVRRRHVSCGVCSLCHSSSLNSIAASLAGRGEADWRRLSGGGTKLDVGGVDSGCARRRPLLSSLRHFASIYALLAKNPTCE